jgi:superoxide reductase
MNKDPKFYVCKKCGNLVGMVHDSGVNPVCCGEAMTEIKANSVDAAKEKHVPVVSVSGNTVQVKIGSVEHPMTAEHYIQWVYLETAKGGQRKNLNPGEKPEVSFSVTAEDKPIAVFAYCNLHGLWKTAIQNITKAND